MWNGNNDKYAGEFRTVIFFLSSIMWQSNPLNNIFLPAMHETKLAQNFGVKVNDARSLFYVCTSIKHFRHLKEKNPKLKL